ncbi:histidine phosphatase family protein [Olsenella sp. YH-ols2217]|uniref:Histidine phosphatase family protein n=1 Tax=Kribbibacterium absianum TaxID=3044210 RepID=A0ABT6ZNM1_9ACTN|nr:MULTISPECIES: histidine phosphatase family protein [unclassified Olsenella]MDJ1122330.1 histidine phosphatase family protein [Olsenella sp. YH-ols2216]MDJ1130256.1 histidine phosphatase family protein [Olsenella sp. YH-ols2217]
MRLLVVRHGETPWNVENRVLGRTDVPLNERGRAQAAELARHLADERICAVFSSPSSRAFETAEAVAAGRGLTVVPDDRLLERDFGIYEGTPRGGEEYQAAKRQFFKRLPEGESYGDMFVRVGSFLEDLRSGALGEFGPDDTVLVATHGGVGRIVASLFQDMEDEEFASFVMANCEALEFEL